MSLTCARRSRNGWGRTAPPSTTRISPPCSTTKTRPLPSPAFASPTGFAKPCHAGSSATVTRAASNGAALGAVAAGAAAVGGAGGGAGGAVACVDTPPPAGSVACPAGAAPSRDRVSAPHAITAHVRSATRPPIASARLLLTTFGLHAVAGHADFAHESPLLTIERGVKWPGPGSAPRRRLDAFFTSPAREIGPTRVTDAQALLLRPMLNDLLFELLPNQRRHRRPTLGGDGAQPAKQLLRRNDRSALQHQCYASPNSP